MRAFALVGLLGALFACGDGADEDALELRFPTLGDEVSELPLQDSQPGSMRSFPLEVKSTSDRGVTLAARFEGEAPLGIRVKIWERRRDLLPQGSVKTFLQFVMPKREGAFEGRVVLYSPELPGWQRAYDVVGSIRARPLSGRYLRARPAGVDCGAMEPGEERDFVVALENFGDEDLAVDAWEAQDERIRITPLREPETIVPRGTIQMRGRVRAPILGGAFRSLINVRSNAQNIQGRLTVVVTGRVTPAYGMKPPRLPAQVLYPMLAPPVRVTAVAAEGRAPFTVGTVTGHERYFELVSKGAETPAREQPIVFKLRRDAPIDVRTNQEFTITFRLEPVGVEVRWPVTLRLLPPVHPRPDKFNLGSLERGRPVMREFVLATIGVRDFDVTSVRAERGDVVRVVPKKRSAGMQWQFLLAIPGDAPPGPFQDTIVIETTDPDVPLIRVPVQGVIR